jgi:hypothetical protein
MQLLPAILFSLVISSVALGQSYTISTFAGGGLPIGVLGTSASLGVNVPRSVASDRAGNLYFARQDSVLRLDAGTGMLTLFAGDGTSGALFIADTENYRIRRVINGVITTAAGNGSVGSGGDNGPATSAQLSGPGAVAVDSLGSLYIADYGHARIRKVSNGVITTIAGNGTDGFSGDNGPATSAQFYFPAGIALGSSGAVYVADRFNNRIRALTPSGPSCSASVNMTNVLIAAAGGELTIAIQTGGSCAWAIQSLPAWITYSEKNVGIGPATISLVAAANPGLERSATVSIAGIPVSVRQSSLVPSISPGGVLNAASFAVRSAVAPGSIASVFGTFPQVLSAVASALPLPTTLAELSIELGTGLRAPIFAVSAGQVNFQVPWELAGQTQTLISSTVKVHTSAAAAVDLTLFAPGIFSMNQQGTGQGAILDTTYRLVDSSNPARAGNTVVQIYCTGLGSVTNTP